MHNIIRKLDLVTLVLFNSIYETGSLSKAAQHNDIALSAVSRRLTELEQAIGTALFFREARGMKLTPAGESFLHYSRHMITTTYKMSTEIEEYKAGLKGFVRLQANLAAITQFLPEDLNQFLSHNPAIKIELEQHISSDIIKNVQYHHTDLGICIAQTQDSTLDYQPYRQDNLVLVAQNNRYLSAYGITDLATALDHDMIGLQAQSSINQKPKDHADSLSKMLKLRMLVSSFDALCRMVQVGMGIGIMPYQAFIIIGKPMNLAYLPIQETWANRTLYLISYSDELLTPATRMLKQHLLNYPNLPFSK